jgi:transcriptional regulator with XRE-family HTH domain
LARRAGISHTQVSRVEAGQVEKPSREILVAVSRALDRNPTPLLILAGHLEGREAREALLPLFREDAELPEVWGDWATFNVEQVNTALLDPGTSEAETAQIAFDVFYVEESDETLWDDSYQLAAARGENARQLQDFMSTWRYLSGDLKTRWLSYGRKLRDIADLEYRAEKDQISIEVLDLSKEIDEITGGPAPPDYDRVVEVGERLDQLSERLGALRGATVKGLRK